MALIVVEIELHVHRQMLQVFKSRERRQHRAAESGRSSGKKHRSVLKMLRGGSSTGTGILIKLWARLQFFSIFDIHMKLI